MRDGWRETTLGEVASRVIGRTPKRRESRYWTNDLSLPFFTIADMQDRRVTTGREGVTQQAVEEGQAKRVPAGSLLLSFKLSIGKVVITDRDVFPNEAIAWIRPTADVNRDYLALALESVKWNDLGGRAVKGKTMNSASLDAVPLVLPPLDEQRRIVDLIGALDRVIALHAVLNGRAAGGHLHQLRSNLLTALLSGEHEIPESYDELMEV